MPTSQAPGCASGRSSCCCCSMARPGSGPPLFADTRLSYPLGFDSDIPSHRERFVLVFCTWNVRSPSTTKWSALDCPGHTIRISVPVPQGPLKTTRGESTPSSRTASAAPLGALCGGMSPVWSSIRHGGSELSPSCHVFTQCLGPYLTGKGRKKVRSFCAKKNLAENPSGPAAAP